MSDQPNDHLNDPTQTVAASDQWQGRAARYQPVYLDGFEEVEYYQPGGYPPIFVGSTLCRGRYRILQKLGYGSSSTVWLARDTLEPTALVTLKALRADVSQVDVSQVRDLAIPKHLHTLYPSSDHFQSFVGHFFEQTPNGTHLVIIYPLAGPNVASFCLLPATTYPITKRPGCRRLRLDLAKKVARDTVTGLQQMHSAGIVHGDMTSANLLIRIAPKVLQWSDEEIMSFFGEPETFPVLLVEADDSEDDEDYGRAGPPLPYAPASHGLHAPPYLCAPVPVSKLCDTSILQERTFINDFGQSYFAASPPPDYRPGTISSYRSPELYFERRVGFESDVWSMACIIFEICTGDTLFHLSWSLNNNDLAMHYAELLGPLPLPWLKTLNIRCQEIWFTEDGHLKSIEDQQRYQDSLEDDAVFLFGRKRSLQELLRLTADIEPSGEDEGPMCEKPNKALDDDEVELLADLLSKMLRYRPEDRITMAEVINHPWFFHDG